MKRAEFLQIGFGGFATLAFASCRKETLDPKAPVKVKTLAPYDANGTPSNVFYVQPTADELVYVNKNVKERQDVRTANPSWYSEQPLISNITNNTAHVFLQNIYSGVTGIPSTLMFYTYAGNNAPKTVAEIKDYTVVFPHTGAGSGLKEGAAVDLGSFRSNTRIGLVLVQNGWDIEKGQIRDLSNPKAVKLFLDDSLNENQAKQVLSRNNGNWQYNFFEDEKEGHPDNDHDYNELVVRLNCNVEFPFQAFPGQIITH